MKNVLILGASGTIASRVIQMLAENDEVQLTLFIRKAARLGKDIPSNAKIIEGDVQNDSQLSDATKSQDIVYGNLAGDLGAMAANIVRAMDEQGVKRLIFISSVGIYDTPLRPVLRHYKAAADVIEASDLDYTVVRPTWFTGEDEIDFELTHKGEPERGSVVSEKSVATLITEIILDPAKYVRESIGINKPNS